MPARRAPSPSRRRQAAEPADLVCGKSADPALIIHIIRTNRFPFLQGRSSWSLAVMSVCVTGVGLALPYTSLGTSLGFTALPPGYWVFLAPTLLGYALLTQGVKGWLLRRGWI